MYNESVYRLFYFSASMCKKTWSNLREAHRRAMKKKSARSGQAAEKKWQYEDHMSFLVPYYKERATVSSVHRDSDQEITANDDSQLSAPDYQSDASIIEDCLQSASSINSPKLPNLKRSRRLEEDELSASSTSLLMKYLIEDKEKRNGEDDVDLFLSGIAATVKKFTDYNKALIKSQIFNVVSQMELQEINEKRENYCGSNNCSPAGSSGYTTTTNYESEKNISESDSTQQVLCKQEEL